MSGPQRSPSQTQLVPKSPSSTSRVFEFPDEYYPETPNTNFDFEDFARAANENAKSSGGGGNDLAAPRSPGHYSLPGQRSPKSPQKREHSVFQHGRCRNAFGKTLSYPPKNETSSSSSSSSLLPSKFTGRLPSSLNFAQRSYDKRRNSCGLAFAPMSPLSPTIVATSSHSPTGRKYVANCDDDRVGECGDKPGVLDSPQFTSPGSNLRNFNSFMECGTDANSPFAGIRGKNGKNGRRHMNKSHGCLNEADDGNNSSGNKSDKSISRRSTSDLTELGETETEVTILSSPGRRSSMKGGLAYLASRRGSRDSQASNLSNISNEDVGPLSFSAHSRVQQRRTSNFLELPVPSYIRPRVHSLPEQAYNPRAGDDLYRLRAFSITHKGVVNRGDSIISRRSRSNTSVNSSRNSNVSGERSPFDGSCCSGQGVAIDSSESEIEEITKYRVILLGDSGVGKTALVSQFMTSEYMNTYDASLDDEFGEKTVSILLDGEESEMAFIDHPHVEMSVENSLSTYEPHACIVVYSIDSRDSFKVAEEMLNYLWREHYTQDRSVIVVGNKSDLARSRAVTANEGKQLATSRGCKFIETSSGIQHNVDELLVGVLKQIRLRESRDKKLRKQSGKTKVLSKLQNSKTVLNLNLAREILNKMCLNDSKSKSCENLHVL